MESVKSHELRTPLASTLNYLKLLKEGFYDDEDELQEYVQVAYQSAANLTNIINDVLDIAKIEAGRMQVNWELVNLGTLLAEKCDLFKIESQSKKVPLIIESEVNIVWADQIKLGQVLTNLISNAFKFTHSGEVRVTAVKLPSLSPSAPPMVEIAVSDTGIGIEPNQKNRLFEAFVQADGSVRRGYGGTGLGLTICKRLVELMGGQIKLHSEGLGKGTTVSFTLLAQQPSNQK